MNILTKKTEADIGPIIPKGPKFSRACRINYDFDGTIFSFIAPKHSPRRKSQKPQEPVNNFYKLDEVNFTSYYNKDRNVSNNWRSLELFDRSWAFNGPWFTGAFAELYLSCRLVKLVNYNKNEFSLFHPRAFENHIADYLTNLYSKNIDEVFPQKKHVLSTPVNWHPLDHLSVNAVQLETVTDDTIRAASVTHHVYLPIGDDLFLSFYFRPSQIRSGTQEDLDKTVSRSTMNELMDNIINSIQVTLSPEALAQQKAAVEGLDDTSLVKEFLPLQWDDVNMDDDQKKIKS